MLAALTISGPALAAGNVDGDRWPEIGAAIDRGRWAEVRRGALEAAAELNPSTRTVGALAGAGMIETSLAVARRSFPSSRAPLLLAVVEQAVGLATPARLEIIAQAETAASADAVPVEISAEHSVAVARAYARLGREAEARAIWGRALSRASAAGQPAAATALRRMADASAAGDAGRTPDWMLSSLTDELARLPAGTDRGFSHIALAKAWFARIDSARTRANLEAAEQAGRGTARAGDRRLVLESAARLALETGEPAFALRLVDEGELAVELSAFHARQGDRARALQMLARIGPDGLYVSHRMAAMQTIAGQALARGDAEEAAFYVASFGELPAMKRVSLWTELGRLQAAQGQRVRAESSLAKAQATIPGTPDPHSSNLADVATLLRLARAMGDLGLAGTARATLDAAARQTDYISLRRGVERAQGRIELARGHAERGDRRMAEALIRQAWTEFHSAQRVRPAHATEQAELLLALAQACGALSR